jgi:sugar O-acyltransferase (sialic acid O-acetyltransferase NeuD family)
MKPTKIGIYGAGGFGREVAWLTVSCNKKLQKYKVACFISDILEEQGEVINNRPVYSLEDAYKRYPTASVVRAIGNPIAGEKAMLKAKKKGFGSEVIIHPNVEISEHVQIGKGTIICAGNIITTNIIIGDHVQINLDCTIGHDSILGDFTTLSPGVHISGWVHMGKRVYIGTGAVIINGTPQNPIKIGDDVVIGAGACVLKSIAPRVKVFGVPAKPMQ